MTEQNSIGLHSSDMQPGDRSAFEETKIVDFSEQLDYDKRYGLSDEQVSRLASDMLNTMNVTEMSRMPQLPFSNLN